jgi:4-diphosphocytidyl-2-C-methyl-D-erythritol kinase
VTPLTLAAPAKVNLSLRVVRRRDDGLHELDSILVLIDLADRLRLLPGCSGLRVADVDGAPVPGVPVRPDENLAWRGLAAGLRASPDDAMTCLSLEKSIPVAAGLGGGSSDAAAAWHLGRAWRGELASPSRDEVSDLAGIGADVPFFAAAVPAARVRGIGEQVDTLPVTATSYGVLVLAPFPLATAAVFAATRASDWSGEGPATVAEALSAGTNDLLAAARRCDPRVDELAAIVVGAGGAPRLTGSGATLFVVTDGPDRSAALAAGLGRARVRAKPYATRLTAASIER